MPGGAGNQDATALQIFEHVFGPLLGWCKMPGAKAPADRKEKSELVAQAGLDVEVAALSLSSPKPLLPTLYTDPDLRS